MAEASEQRVVTLEPAAVSLMPVIVYFGVFGQREYRDYVVIDAVAGAGQITCRWCVGEGEPDIDCAACKNTRRMWVGL